MTKTGELAWEYEDDCGCRDCCVARAIELKVDALIAALELGVAIRRVNQELDSFESLAVQS